MRAGRWVLRAGLLVPPVIIAIWGGIYLRDCARALQTPLHGVTFWYESASGIVRAHAGRFQADLSSGSVSADDVLVLRPDGLPIARARSVVGRLSLPWTPGRAYRVELVGASVLLERRSDGRWSYEDFLPPPERRRPSEVPYDVRLRDAEVQFFDGALKRPRGWRIHVYDGRVAGVLERFTATINADIEGEGAVTGSFDLADGKVLHVNATTTGLQLAHIRRYLVNWTNLAGLPILAHWDAKTAFYRGNVQIQAAERTGGTHWEAVGHGTLTATGLTTHSRRFDDFFFEGSFSEAVAAGDFRASGRGLQASARGSIRLRAPFLTRLEGNATVGDARALAAVLNRAVPEELSFSNARFEGSVELGEVLKATGRLTANSVAWVDYEATGFRTEVVGDGQAIRLRDAEGSVQGSPASGEFAILTGDEPQIEGYASASAVPIHWLPGLPKDKVLGGNIDIEAHLSGPLESVSAELRATGRADVAIRSERKSVIESVDIGLRGHIAERNFEIIAAEVAGPSGVVWGWGTVALDGSSLSLRVSTNALEIGSLPDSPADGTAFAELVVGGSVGSPIVQGSVEVYAAAIGDFNLPFVSARADWENRVLSLSDVRAQSGASLVTGNAAVDFAKDKSLSGSGDVVDLALGQFTDRNVQGLASGAWELGGTLTDPMVDALLSSDTLFADRIEVKSAKAAGRWRGGALHLDALSAKIDGGEVKASGEVALEGPGGFSFTVESVPASALQPYAEGSAKLGGTLDGSGRIGYQDGALADGSAEIEMRNVEVNDEPIGAGRVTARLDNDRVRVSGEVGSLEGYYILDEAVYDLDSKVLTAAFSTLDASLNQAARVSTKYYEKDLSFDEREQLLKLDGKVTVRGHLMAERQPAETAPVPERANDAGWRISRAGFSLTARELSYERKPIGGIEAVASKQDTLWTIEQADWTGGPAGFRLTPTHVNTIDESGEISLDGELDNVDLSWFASVNPQIAGLRGTLDVPFTVTGETRSPEIVASVSAADLSFRQVAADGLSVGPVLIKEGEISAEQGSLQVRGLTAELKEARLPFHFPFEVPTDEPIRARIVVPDRDINELSRFFGGLDEQVTQGRVFGGEVTVAGTLDAPETRGAISAEAPRLKFDEFDQAFTDVRATARFEGSTLRVNAQGAGAGRGSFEIGGGIDFREGVVVEGTRLLADRLYLRDEFGTGILAEGIFSADLSVAGNISEPHVAGRVSADKALLDLAGEFTEREAAALFPINPYFDVSLELASGRFESGPLDADARGRGSLKGTFSQPAVEMNLAVERGEISLPSGRIRFEEGGTARFAYDMDWRGQPDASLDVALRATTYATVTTGISVQRYTINLFITGDLLGEEDLRIEATSDPPDLSRDEIMAILGQQRLFEEVAGAAFGDFQTQLKTVLTSVAAPALLNPITRGIERTFGLDYVSLDFNKFGLGTLTLAKALGNGFVLEYRKQLDRYATTDRPLEEVKISYTPPTRNPILSRLSMSLAMDREGLLKLSLGYSRRF